MDRGHDEPVKHLSPCSQTLQLRRVPSYMPNTGARYWSFMTRQRQNARSGRALHPKQTVDDSNLQSQLWGLKKKAAVRRSKISAERPYQDAGMQNREDPYSEMDEERSVAEGIPGEASSNLDRIFCGTSLYAFCPL